MQQHEVYEFDFVGAVAFGDSPDSNDAPLMNFVEQGMPFVSVAKSVEQVPPEHRHLHVGGLEHGTARGLQNLLDVVTAANSTTALPQHGLKRFVGIACEKALEK